jgi:hypothetical protein
MRTILKSNGNSGRIKDEIFLSRRAGNTILNNPHLNIWDPSNKLLLFLHILFILQKKKKEFSIIFSSSY